METWTIFQKMPPQTGNIRDVVPMKNTTMSWTEHDANIEVSNWVGIKKTALHQNRKTQTDILGTSSDKTECNG